MKPNFHVKKFSVKNTDKTHKFIINMTNTFIIHLLRGYNAMDKRNINKVLYTFIHNFVHLRNTCFFPSKKYKEVLVVFRQTALITLPTECHWR